MGNRYVRGRGLGGIEGDDDLGLDFALKNSCGAGVVVEGTFSVNVFPFRPAWMYCSVALSIDKDCRFPVFGIRFGQRGP